LRTSLKSQWRQAGLCYDNADAGLGQRLILVSAAADGDKMAGGSDVILTRLSRVWRVGQVPVSRDLGLLAAQPAGLCRGLRDNCLNENSSLKRSANAPPLFYSACNKFLAKKDYRYVFCLRPSMPRAYKLLLC